MKLIDVAASAYDAYGSVTEYKNYSCNPMPKWEELPETIKMAWVSAATKAIEMTGGKIEGDRV